MLERREIGLLWLGIRLFARMVRGMKTFPDGFLWGTATAAYQIEGAVAWEPEHGLQMSWENGETLVKSGAYDGHPTNGHAFADPAYDSYVFYCSSPNLRTKREGG